MDRSRNSAANQKGDRPGSARLSDRTIEEWQEWIASMSPRQAVRRMYQWQWIAEDKPAAREDLLAVVDLVRKLLVQREHRAT